MKELAVIALLATASMAQVAYGASTLDAATPSPFVQVAPGADNSQLAYLPLEPTCPEGTALTEIGHCQPYWDFD